MKNKLLSVVALVQGVAPHVWFGSFKWNTLPDSTLKGILVSGWIQCSHLSIGKQMCQPQLSSYKWRAVVKGGFIVSWNLCHYICPMHKDFVWFLIPKKKSNTFFSYFNCWKWHKKSIFTNVKLCFGHYTETSMMFNKTTNTREILLKLLEERKWWARLP